MKPLFGAGLLVLFLCSLAMAAPDDEPRDVVRPLSELIAELESDDGEVRGSAAEQLGQRCQPFREFLGWDPAGAAVLERLLGSSNPLLSLQLGRNEPNPLVELKRFRDEATPLVEALIRLLDSSDETCRRQAAEVLMVIGPAAGDARAALRKRIQSGDFSPSHVYAILHVSPAEEDVGPQLIDDIAGGIKVRSKAGETEPAEVPADQELFGAATGAVELTLMLKTSRRTLLELPTLVKLTDASYPRAVRALALFTLSYLDAEASAAVPALKEHLSDDDPKVRWLVGWTVVVIQGDRSQVSPTVEAMKLDEAEATEFERATEVYFRTWDEARQHFHDEVEAAAAMTGELFELLRFAPPCDTRMLVRMIGVMGATAKPMIPELVRLLEHPDPATRAAARQALQQIDLGRSVTP